MAKYEAWKTGATEMSADLRQRLLALVPPYLSFDQKYALVEQIWLKCRFFGSHHFVVDSQKGIESSLKAIDASLRASLQRCVPTKVIEALKWLSDDDAIVGQALVCRFFEREMAIVTSKLRAELEFAF